MPIIGAKGSPSSGGFGQFAQASTAANYIEDVFSTYLYTGNGTTGASTQTITNNIDLSTYGGLVWLKNRSNVADHYLNWQASAQQLASNTTAALTNVTSYLSALNTNGFDVRGNGASVNTNGNTYASWTFRKQPKFFDVVTYTGNGSSSQTVSHNLGSTPGFIVIKRTDSTGWWGVIHRGSDPSVNGWITGGGLNSTNALTNTVFSTVATSTIFYPSDVDTNGNGNFITNGATYVAYLFAHNAGGFGLTGTDNVISCGSFTTDGDGNATVNLGYEPQFLIQRMSENADDWYMLDIMRGSPYTYAIGVDNQKMLKANTSGAEANTNGRFNPNATGFNVYGLSGSSVYIYIAIRRGPMKVPTDATKVFSPNQTSGTTGTPITTGFPVDWQLLGINAGNVYNQRSSTRLTGVNTDGTSNSQYLVTSNTNAEAATGSLTLNWNNTGFQVPSLNSGNPIITWNFQRAPSFFDEVCYTGTGANRTVEHNLGVPPELMIIKKRSSAANWVVYSAALGNATQLVLDSASAASASSLWQNTTPTASVFSINTATTVNSSGSTYVAYLFATCAGVSKVGRYSGTGSAQTINCGFTSGARFVLIKQDNSNSRNWYVWDSARGITSSNDPFLWLNTTDAENTSTNYVDTDSTGFKLTASAPSQLNAASGTYIFLAIA